MQDSQYYERDGTKYDMLRLKEFIKNIECTQIFSTIPTHRLVNNLYKERWQCEGSQDFISPRDIVITNRCYAKEKAIIMESDLSKDLIVIYEDVVLLGILVLCKSFLLKMEEIKVVEIDILVLDLFKV